MRTQIICAVAGALVIATAAAERSAAEVIELRTDVCIVGGGSGGCGAAIAAARAGVGVVLVERQRWLGGTSTSAYVCSWPPGPADSIAREVYQRLSKLPNAVGISSDHNADRRKGPFGLWLITPGQTYRQTLRRVGLPREQQRAVVFDPAALDKVLSQMLAETGNCRVLPETDFVEAKTEGKRVLSIAAESADGSKYRIRARVFIDSTGGVALCRKIGCETMLGPESASRFGEPSAPREPGMTLNAISLCYRIRPSNNPVRQPEPDTPVKGWPRSAHVGEVPGGDLIVNPLALVPGRTLIDVGYRQTMVLAKRRAQAHWRWLQGYPTFAGYELDRFAPMLGIRESYRVVGEYVLTEHDLRRGLQKQGHQDVIALADHSMDVHGKGGRRVHGQLEGPYGIPYRCLVPKGQQNLLVACRGASFSHVAASSCRLSRTMIALGHAAGLAAAMAVENNVPVGDIDVAALQRQLGIPLREPQGTSVPRRQKP